MKIFRLYCRSAHVPWKTHVQGMWKTAWRLLVISRKERSRTQLQRAQYGSRIDAIRRIMWYWPPPAQFWCFIHRRLDFWNKKSPKLQGISISPYLKCDLFSFNESYIGPVEVKIRQASSNPVKFFCRCCDSLCFELPPPNQTKDSFEPISIFDIFFYKFYPI